MSNTITRTVCGFILAAASVAASVDVQAQLADGHMTVGVAFATSKNYTPTSIQVESGLTEMPAIGKDHCGGCHAVEEKLYAPSFRDIAIKYRGDIDAVSKLTKHINSGGMFGWNMGIRMPPKGIGANDREVKAMVEFITGLPIEDPNSK